MKYLQYSAFGILILFVTVSSLTQSPLPTNSFAELEISATKSEYLLGEPVIVESRLRRIGDRSVNHRYAWGDRDLVFWIAKGGDEFLGYRFGKITAEASLSFSEGMGRYRTTDAIFFNSKPVTYNLSENDRRKVERGMILTDYAFPEPGEYRIKSTLLFGRGGGEISERIWSNEISISVKEPEGDDLRVWEIMKADPRIGYFMMEGVVPYRVPSIEDTFLAEIDRITSQYPNSYLAGLLKAKAQENRARRERYRR